MNSIDQKIRMLEAKKVRCIELANFHKENLHKSTESKSAVSLCEKLVHLITIDEIVKIDREISQLLHV